MFTKLVTAIFITSFGFVALITSCAADKGSGTKSALSIDQAAENANGEFKTFTDFSNYMSDRAGVIDKVTEIYDNVNSFAVDEYAEAETVKIDAMITAATDNEPIKLAGLIDQDTYELYDILAAILKPGTAPQNSSDIWAGELAQDGQEDPENITWTFNTFLEPYAGKEENTLSGLGDERKNLANAIKSDLIDMENNKVKEGTVATLQSIKDALAGSVSAALVATDRCLDGLARKKCADPKDKKEARRWYKQCVTRLKGSLRAQQHFCNDPDSWFK